LEVGRKWVDKEWVRGYYDVVGYIPKKTPTVLQQPTLFLGYKDADKEGKVSNRGDIPNPVYIPKK
jgi:hypothetical protein